MSNVTVIIPHFNMAENLKRAVASAEEQKCVSEIIVVDDGSNPAIDSANFPQCKVISSSENCGAGHARNLGIQAARSEWIAFLDADDVLHPGVLDDRLKQAQATLESGVFSDNKTVFACGWEETDAEGNAKIQRTPRGTETPADFASGCWWCPGSTLLARKSVFLSDNRFFDTKLRRLEDYDWGIRFALAGGKLVVHNDIGVTIAPSGRGTSETVDQAAEYLTEKFSSLKDTDSNIHSNIRAYLSLERATYALRDRRPLEALKSLASSYLAVPRLKRHFSPGWIVKPNN